MAWLAGDDELTINTHDICHVSNRALVTTARETYFCVCLAGSRWKRRFFFLVLSGPDSGLGSSRKI